MPKPAGVISFRILIVAQSTESVDYNPEKIELFSRKNTEKYHYTRNDGSILTILEDRVKTQDIPEIAVLQDLPFPPPSSIRPSRDP